MVGAHPPPRNMILVGWFRTAWISCHVASEASHCVREGRRRKERGGEEREGDEGERGDRRKEERRKKNGGRKNEKRERKKERNVIKEEVKSGEEGR